MTSAQKDLLKNLAALRQAVAATTTLASILDKGWFDAFEAEIRRSSSPSVFTADPSGFLYDFCHPLRGVDWFESDQKSLLRGRVDKIDEDARFVLSLCGVDPLLTIIPLLESRLQAFAALPIKVSVVSTKLKEARVARTNASFKNHLFEISVLGDLALRKVLVDIEDSTTRTDGVIDIDGRGILVEATNTTQRVRPDITGAYSLDPNVEIDQVVKKLRKKVAEGRQLALADGRPTLLFLGRRRLGAGRVCAQIALSECFRAADFAALSGVVLADSWKLFATSWHPGVTPDVPFSKLECRRLEEWYSQK